ncbi:3-hydroxylacyl-ACP dehydratase, partial [Streptomyces sp. NPDC127044]
MRFHLIDRIETCAPREHITARKVTSAEETYWQDTGDGPALPFGLALEALCQSATWLIMLSTDHRLRAALLAVGEATAHRPVRPGEVLRMHATVESMTEVGPRLDPPLSLVREIVHDASRHLLARIDR